MVRVSNRLPSLETLRAGGDEPSSGHGIGGGGHGSSLPPPPTLREREREDAKNICKVTCACNLLSFPSPPHVALSPSHMNNINND